MEVIRGLCSLRERPGDPVPLGVSVQPFKEGAIVRLFDGRRKARIIVGVAGIESRVECLKAEDDSLDQSFAAEGPGVHEETERATGGCRRDA